MMFTALTEERHSFPAPVSHSAMEVLLLHRVGSGLLHFAEHSKAPAASFAFAQLEVRRGQLPSTADRGKASLRVTSPTWQNWEPISH